MPKSAFTEATFFLQELGQREYAGKGNADKMKWAFDRARGWKDLSKYADRYLAQAINLNRMDLIEEAVRAGASFDVVFPNGRTLMHYAAEAGHPGMVEFLHKKGLKVNVVDKLKQTPAHLAASHTDKPRIGHPKTIKKLHELEAALEELNELDESPVELAVQKGYISTVKMFHSIDPQLLQGHSIDGGQTLMHRAASVGDKEMIQLLHDLGVNATDPDFAGAAPQMYAQLHGHDAAVKLLQSLAKKGTAPAPPEA